MKYKNVEIKNELKDYQTLLKWGKTNENENEFLINSKKLYWWVSFMEGYKIKAIKRCKLKNSHLYKDNFYAIYLCSWREVGFKFKPSDVDILTHLGLGNKNVFLDWW